MWRRHSSALDWVSYVCWWIVHDQGLIGRRMVAVAGHAVTDRDGISPFGSPESRAVLDGLIQACLDHSGPNVDETSFRHGVELAFKRVVSQFEHTGDYSVLPEMWKYVRGIRYEDDSLGALAAILWQCLRMLLGSETMFLYGTRGGPAFIPVSPTITTYGHFRSTLSYLMGVEMSYLDKSDRAMIPRPEEWYSDLDDQIQAEPHEYPIRELLEEAYYSQRYTVHPDGVYVRLKGLWPLVGLTLKVKSGLRDRNYIDLVVTFESDATAFGISGFKKTTMVFDGTLGLGLTKMIALDDNPRQFAFSYLHWVAAMIYHDLVTAKHINVGIQHPSDRQLSHSVKRPNDSVSWVYIPRIVKRRPVEPRTTLGPSSRSTTPHHVTGHFRNANLSQAHREELEKFEIETGLQVLDWLDSNPGWTYVRPHISPSSADVKNLPRFIHARLQSEIELMKARRVK